jgi:general secretion pathway protein A
LNNPVLSPEDFVRTLAARFELGPAAAVSKAVLLDTLEKTLRHRRAHGVITALVVDEAQSLSVALLEEIRLLANIETPTMKLLPLVLAGQPELGERLEEQGLRQLKQRVTLRCELTPFGLSDTAAYIAARITKAGGVPARLFTLEAVTLIHESSRGIPRVINVICDNALVTGMAMRRAPIDRAIVAEVCGDLHLRREVPKTPPILPMRANTIGDGDKTPAVEEAGGDSPPESVSQVRRRSWFGRRSSAASFRDPSRIITE